MHKLVHRLCNLNSPIKKEFHHVANDITRNIQNRSATRFLATTWHTTYVYVGWHLMKVVDLIGFCIVVLPHVKITPRVKGMVHLRRTY